MADKKPIYKQKTFWMSVITIVTMIAGSVGVDIPAEAAPAMLAIIAIFLRLGVEGSKPV